MSVFDQEGIDRTMLELDGTRTRQARCKRHPGVSLAAARAAAAVRGEISSPILVV